MKVVRFVANADPSPMPRLGLARDGKIVDLQAAHFAMTGAPHPHLREPDALRARHDASDFVQRVAEWALGQDAPGTSVAEGAVRVLETLDFTPVPESR